MFMWGRCIHRGQKLEGGHQVSQCTVDNTIEYHTLQEPHYNHQTLLKILSHSAIASINWIKYSTKNERYRAVHPQMGNLSIYRRYSSFDESNSIHQAHRSGVSTKPICYPSSRSSPVFLVYFSCNLWKGQSTLSVDYAYLFKVYPFVVFEQAKQSSLEPW